MRHLSALWLGLAALTALTLIGSTATAVEPNETISVRPRPDDQAVLGGSVSRAVFTTAVVHREPVDELNESTISNQRHLYYFTELKGLTGARVAHRWSYQGEVMAEIKFEVGGPRWRVWSSKTLLPDWTGQWTVSVVDSTGRLIHQDRFSYHGDEPAVP